MTKFLQKTFFLKLCFGLVWHNYDAVSVDRVLFYFLICASVKDDHKFYITVQKYWVLAYNEEHSWLGGNFFTP